MQHEPGTEHTTPYNRAEHWHLGSPWSTLLSPHTRLILSIAVVVVVLIGGTLGYMLVMGQSAFNSLYMTVITLTTVGYEEVFELDTKGQILTMVIIMVGYGAVAISLANLVSLVISGELRKVREGQRMKAQINGLDKHVIICGCGRMGALIASAMQREGAGCVVVDKIESDEAQANNFLFIRGDATEDSVLLEAGALRASALVSCLSSDADNVYVTLTARELNPQLKIISRALHSTTEAKLRRAGADSVISPQVIGANKIVTMLRRPDVVDFVDMAAEGVNIGIAQYEVRPDSPLVGTPLCESGIREKTGVIVVAIKRADGVQIFSPGPREVIEANDQLVLIGRGGLSERLDTLQGP